MEVNKVEEERKREKKKERKRRSEMRDKNVSNHISQPQ